MLVEDLEDARTACAAAARIAANSGEILRRRAAASGWSPAQHLDHLALANDRILRALDAMAAGRSRPREGPAAEGAAALLRDGAIPRGTAQAPRGTEPPAEPDVADLRARLADVRARFDGLDAETVARLGGARPHPALGLLTAPEWIRFAAIHTRHHLAIVRELLEPEA